MSEIQQLKEQVDDLTVALEQFGVFNMNATKKMGVFEKQQKKVTTALKRSPLNAIRLQLQGFAESMVNVVKRGVLFSNLNKKQQDELKGNMTVMEKLAAATIAHGVAVKFGNKLLDKKNTLFRRIMVSAFSLVSIFLIVGFALAALSIAFEGANSPLLKFTEDLGPLHDAMQGLVFVISGEGDEGGLATSLDIFAAGLLAAGVASLVLGGTVGVLVGAVVLAVGAYRMLSAEFENSRLAMVAAIGVFTVLIGIFVMIKAGAIAAALGISTAVASAVGAVIAGIGLVVGGIAGMVAFAMGAGEGIKGLLIGVVSAFSIAIGAILLGVAAVPAAIAAAIVFVIALIVRYWEEISTFLSNAFTFVVNGLSGLFSWIVNGVGDLFSFIINGIATFAVNAFNGFVGLVEGVIGLFTGLVESVVGLGQDIVDFFVSIPGAIKDGFVKGFKTVFNGIAGIYNGFAEKMSFDIPNWVPVVGGKEFKLPKIPLLAEGGIGSRPTLAMVGEDGPEAVVPLNRKNNPTGIGLGGGMTVNINVGGVTDRTDKKQLAREIGDLIRAEMTRSGRSHGNRRSGV